MMVTEDSQNTQPTPPSFKKQPSGMLRRFQTPGPSPLPRWSGAIARVERALEARGVCLKQVDHGDGRSHSPKQLKEGPAAA